LSFQKPGGFFSIKMVEEKHEEIVEEKNELKSSEKAKCTLCGICKFSCPTYKFFFNEAVSPRGKAIMLKKRFPSKYFYLCTLCKACEESCILKDINTVERIREFRKHLIDQGMTTESNKAMIENIRNFGNPFGEIKEGKKLALYCC